jgi:hypothetical protein
MLVVGGRQFHGGVLSQHEAEDGCCCADWLCWCFTKSGMLRHTAVTADRDAFSGRGPCNSCE